MAIGAFFYAFVVMLLGVVILAAGLALTIAAVDVRTSFETAALLGGGAALYGGRRLSGSSSGSPLRYRLAAILFLLATIPLGSGVRHGPAARDHRGLRGRPVVREARRAGDVHRSRMTTSGPGPIGAPHLARSTEQLTHRRVGVRQRERLERLRLRVEADDGIGREVGQPHAIVVVDVDGVGLCAVAGERPLRQEPSEGRGRRPGRRSIPPPTAGRSRRTRCGGRPARPSAVPRRSPHRFRGRSGRCGCRRATRTRRRRRGLR